MSRSYYSDAYLQHAKENRLRIAQMRVIEESLLIKALEEKELDNTSKEEQEV